VNLDTARCVAVMDTVPIWLVQKINPYHDENGFFTSKAHAVTPHAAQFAQAARRIRSVNPHLGRSYIRDADSYVRMRTTDTQITGERQSLTTNLVHRFPNVAAAEASENQVREHYQRFTAATGVPVRVTRNRSMIRVRAELPSHEEVARTGGATPNTTAATNFSLPPGHRRDTDPKHGPGMTNLATGEFIPDNPNYAAPLSARAQASLNALRAQRVAEMARTPTRPPAPPPPPVEPAKLEYGFTGEGSGVTRKAEGHLTQPPSERLSTLSEREIKLRLEDAGITLTGRSYGDSPKAVAKDFEDKMGMDVLAYKKHLLGELQQLPGGVKERGTTFIIQVGDSSIHSNGSIKTDQASITLNRKFDFASKSVYHAYQEILTRDSRLWSDANVQGGGKCAAMFERSLDIYDHLGFKKVTVGANLSVGGHAWARYGFVPDQHDWDNKRRGYAASSLPALQRHNPGVAASVKKILDNPDPKAMLQFAAIKTKGPDGKPIGMGYLVGTSWHGTIDLTDPKRYEVTRAYSNNSLHKRRD
jgi:hypothetical protein